MNLNPINNSLTHEYVFVDNELQDSLTRLNFWSIFGRYGITAKRTGSAVKEVVFTLLVWVFLNQSSINSFQSIFKSIYCLIPNYINISANQR